MTKVATGTRLKAFRGFKGWSQRRLAKAAGVSHGLIGQIERGEIGVTSKTARKLGPLMRVRWTTLCD